MASQVYESSDDEFSEGMDVFKGQLEALGTRWQPKSMRIQLIIATL
jgi:hypothetical protein